MRDECETEGSSQSDFVGFKFFFSFMKNLKKIEKFETI